MRTHKPLFFNIYNFHFNLLFLFLTFLFICGCSAHTQPQKSLLINAKTVSDDAINLNTANAKRLEKLPHIGEELAQRIIEHREKFGRFRRAENLILVRGMSDKKFRDLQNLVKAE